MVESTIIIMPLFERFDLFELAIALTEKYKGYFEYLIEGGSDLNQVKRLTFEFQPEEVSLNPNEILEDVQTFLKTNFSGVPYTYRLSLNDDDYYISLTFEEGTTLV